MNLLQEIKQAVMKGSVNDVKTGITKGLEENISPDTLLFDALIVAMEELGDKFRKNEAFIPEVLIAARAMQAGTELLKPHLGERGLTPKGRVLLGTVKGDLHDIGKNLVRMMLEGNGFEVFDLGVNVSAETFVEKIKELHPQILGLSALLTTTMQEMRRTIQHIEEARLRDGVKILIGGAPVTQRFADEIHADAYAQDAAEAVVIARELLA